MSHYRIYMLDGTARIIDAADAECESDEAALDHARFLAGTGRQMEVWCGARCLGPVAWHPHGPVSPLVEAHVAWANRHIQTSLRQLAARTASQAETHRLIALSHVRLAASRHRL